MGGVTIEHPKTAENLLPVHLKKDAKIEPLKAEGSITAAANTEGFGVSLHNDFRTLCHFFVVLGAAGTIEVQSSMDGTTWHTMWTKTLTAAGTFNDWEFVGHPYFRIWVPTTGIAIEIGIRAIRL